MKALQLLNSCLEIINPSAIVMTESLTVCEKSSPSDDEDSKYFMNCSKLSSILNLFLT